MQQARAVRLTILAREVRAQLPAKFSAELAREVGLSARELQLAAQGRPLPADTIVALARSLRVMEPGATG